ncbi:MAG: ABC transporter permease [Planctomycetes bacterium]|jgi:ribose transport system permease protein|nr:ABC transporter permease [Planctomycetota bacterium]
MTSTTASISARPRLPASVVQYAGMAAALLALITIFSLASPTFASASTAASIANQIPDLTVVAVGMTLVLIVGGIDLSVGSLLALSAAVMGVALTKWGWPLATAVPLALLVGGLCGLINGTISVWARIPSFIVTLGMLEAARGGAYLVADSQTAYIGSSVEWIGAPITGIGLSPAVLTAIAIVIIGQVVLTRTVFGRHLIAIGTNAEAVRMAGIRTAPYAIAVFAVSGLLCGLASVMQTARLSTADPNAAIGMELSAIAACVIGGTSLMGGRGSIVATFFGVLIIAVLQTGLANVGASEPLKRVITGAVIVAAVLLDALRQRWGRTG